MIPLFKNLSLPAQGVLYMAFGAILLLHAAGAFQQLFSCILSLVGIALVIYGFMIMDGPQMMKNALTRFQRRDK